jgi:LemA protein
MSKKWIPLIVIGSIVLIVVLFSVSRYNSLVSSQETVKGHWSEIDNQLKRRADLIPNLVNTVKGAAAHEKEIIDSVTSARAKLAGAGGPVDKAAANAELSSALSRLMVVVENYPQIKANENFRALQDQLEGTENRISTARGRYNEAVKEHNSKIKRFPNNMFAGMFGVDSAEYFEVADADKKTPEVKFN